MSLIGPDQTFALSAIIMVMVTFGLWAENTRWGKSIGGPLLLIAIAMILANIGVIPHVAGIYDEIGGLLVPMAIPLLVMRADFKTIFSESGQMLVCFLVATVATIIGALVAVLVIDMGPLEPQIAGTVTASYIGCTLNYVATAEAVGLKSSSIYVAGLSADAVGAVFFLMLLMLMPAIRFVVVLIGRFMKLDLAEVMIASNACILGPVPAAALAASKGWRPLVTPGILVGLFGYAVATFIGIGFTALLS